MQPEKEYAVNKWMESKEVPSYYVDHRDFVSKEVTEFGKGLEGWVERSPVHAFSFGLAITASLFVLTLIFV